MLSLTALHLYPLRQSLNLKLTDWTSWLTNEFHGFAYLPYFCLTLKNAFMHALIYLYNMCIQAHTYHGAGLLLLLLNLSSCTAIMLNSQSPMLALPQKKVHFVLSTYLLGHDQIPSGQPNASFFASAQKSSAEESLWRPDQSEVISPEPILLHALQCWGLGASSPVRGGTSSPVPLPLLASQPHPHLAWMRGRDVLASFSWVLGI